MRAECKQIFVTVGSPPADKCGGNIRISSASYLTSPGYPLSYAPSQRCTWVISAPGPHQRILINFNPHFDLEDRECKWVAPPVCAQVCVKEPILSFIQKRKQLQIFQFSKSGWMTEWNYKKNKTFWVIFPFFFVVLNLWNRTMIPLFIFDSHQHMRSLVWAWSCGGSPSCIARETTPSSVCRLPRCSRLSLSTTKRSRKAAPLPIEFGECHFGDQNVPPCSQTGLSCCCRGNCGRSVSPKS